MKVFIGEIPSNPYEPKPKKLQCYPLKEAYNEGQASILSQMREVDIDNLMRKFLYQHGYVLNLRGKNFEQFILEANHESTRKV